MAFKTRDDPVIQLSGEHETAVGGKRKMKTGNKKERHKLIAIIIAVMMLVTLAVPALGADKASAAEKTTQQEKVEIEKAEGAKEETTEQESTAELQQEKATEPSSGEKNPSKAAAKKQGKDEPKVASGVTPVKGVKEKIIQSIRVKSLPKDLTAYAGLDFVLCEGMELEVTYTDKTTEVVKYSNGSFNPLKHDSSSIIKLENKKIEVGNNTIKVLCGELEYNDETDEEEFITKHWADFNVKSEKIKLPKSIKVLENPNNEIWIGSRGEYALEDFFLDMKAEISYDDGTKEIISRDTSGFDKIKYAPKGVKCVVRITDPKKISLGQNTMELAYYMNPKVENENIATILKIPTTFTVTAKQAQKIKELKIHTMPKMNNPYAGLDEKTFLNGLSIKAVYTDGTDELLQYQDYERPFDIPSKVGYDETHSLELPEDLALVPGENKITVTYKAVDWETDKVKVKKEASFTIDALPFESYTKEIETQENIPTPNCGDENTILKANKELWHRAEADGGSANYQKKTGIVKAYSRVYLDTQGTATLLDAEGKSIAERTNVKDIGEAFVLLEDGTLVDIGTNKVVASQVKDWYELSYVNIGEEYLVLKENGDVYFRNAMSGTPIKIENVSNVERLGRYELLDQKGDLYKVDFDDDKGIVTATKIQGNVAESMETFVIGTDGKTYYSAIYTDNPSQPVIDTKLIAYKYYNQYDEKEGTEIYGYILVDEEKRIYKSTYYWDDQQGEEIEKPTIKLAGTFKSFTDYGYQTGNGEFFNVQGHKTDIISKESEYCLKTDGMLLYNNQKLLSNVAGLDNYDSPTRLFRTDGSIWLFDEEEPTDKRRRISPPEKLTEELVASLYGKGQVIISTLAVSIPNQTYNGSPKTPAITIKDGTKILKNTVDYTASYSNNLNTGTATATITGKGSYTGTVKKTFTIAKASQSISGTTAFVKTYGNGAFRLGASAKTPLSYRSSNTRVATVSSAGTVTIKGAGTVTITAAAAATSNYNAASKQVKITVRPAPQYIYGATAFTKTYGNRVFRLGASAKTALRYRSSNTRVATVSSAGTVTIKGRGTALITVTAAAASNYNAASKQVRITVRPASQYIYGASAFTKTYGNRAFRLGASAKTSLSYRSSSTRVATVSRTGIITLKGPGTATITIRAAASNNYNTASKQVRITVKPKKAATPKARSTKSRTLKVTWRRDSRASGYQVAIAQNKRFTKGRKTATITRNRTTAKTFNKLRKGKTYYTRVRAYKKYGSKKIYGTYSNMKKVRVR